ncbi:MAG TPA: PAS domain S-box protein [Thermodesulfobacteriota bacterium]|nr:PAS domain S-box protein [Thermodesulfobacteriota bacterium]
MNDQYKSKEQLIGELQQLRERMAEPQDPKRDLLQAVVDGARNCHLVYLDREFNFVRVNETYARTCGYRPEEMIGKNHFALYPDAENEAIFTEVRDTGIAVEFHDKPFVFPDQPGRGVTYWDWVLVPVRDGTGETTGLVFSLTETTSHKRAEDELRQQAQLLDLSNDAIFTWELSGVIRYWNRGAEALYGYHRTEACGRVSHELLATAFPRGLAQVRAELERDGQWGGEVRRTDKGGCQLIIESRMVLIRHNECHLVLETDRDITSRKRLEMEQYRLAQQRQLALDAAHMGWWRYDALTKVVIYDDRCREIFGVSGSQRGNEEIRKRLHPDDLVHVRAAVRAALNPSDPKPYSAEYRINRDDGALRWIEAHGIVSFQGDGDFRLPAGLVGTVTDITERKQTEEELQKSRTELELIVAERTGELSSALKRVTEQEKALRELAQRLRRLSSQLLQAQENERKRVANEIHDNAGQVLAAIKYRVEAACLKLQKAGDSNTLQPVKDLIPTIQNCIHDMRRLQMELRPTILDDMGVAAAVEWFCREFQTTYPSITIERKLCVNEAELADSLKLVIFRIAQEALNNVGKHSGARVVQIVLKEHRGTITLHVDDDGLGFDVGDAQTIKEFGQGLGLSSMRERVEYSGGQLSIQSAPGQGTRIKARWPKQALV